MMKTVKVLLAILGVLLVVGVAWITYLLLYLNENKGFLEQRFTSAIGREVRIDGVSVQWSLTPTIALDGLWIGNPDWAKGEHFVRAQRALVRIDVLELVRKRLEVTEITVHAADVLLETADDGRRNWTFGDGGSGIDVSVTALTVTDSRLIHRWPNGKSYRSEIPEIRLEGLGDKELRLKARLSYQGIPIAASLETLTDADSRAGERPFRGEVEAPSTILKIEGKLQDAYELASIEASFRSDSLDLGKSVLLSRFVSPLAGNLRSIEGRFKSAGDSRDALISNLSGELQIGSAAVTIPVDGADRAARELALDALRLSLDPQGPVRLETGLGYRQQTYRVALTGGLLSDLFAGRKSWETIKLKVTGSAMNKPFEVSGDVGPLAAILSDGVKRVKLKARHDKVHAAVDGKLASLSKPDKSDLHVQVSGPSLSLLKPWLDMALPDTAPFEFGARVNAKNGHLNFEAVEFTAGTDDVSGRFRFPLQAGGRFDGALESRSLDLHRLLSSVDAGAETQEGTVPTMKREFTTNLFHGLDGSLSLKVGRLHLAAVELENVDLESSIDDGRLAVRADAEDGRATTDVKLNPLDDAWHFSVRLESRIELGDLIDRDKHADDRSKSPAEIDAELEGSGRSIDELLASLKGRFTMVLGEGSLSENLSQHLPMGDILYAVLEVIDPLSRTRKQSQLECAVIHLEVENGIAGSSKGLAMRTDKMNVLGNGAVNLQTGEIDLEFKTAQRRGLGLSVASVADRYIRLTGTLDEPQVGVNAKSAIVHGAAAWATGGFSVLYDSLFRRLTSSENPCKRVSEAIAK